MENVVWPSGKPAFVLVRGVLLWGASTALLFTLFGRYTTHRVESAFQIIATFAIFMVLGIPLGLSLWKRANALPRKPSRRAEVTRLVLFWGLMIGFAGVLWVLASR